MLEMLIAANSAFEIIKKTVENGKELASAGSSISKFVQAEDKLQQDLHKKRNSIWTNFLGKADNDLEEFMALEQIKAKKEQLREFMQLYGRPGLYNDWIKYVTDARRMRKEAADKRAKKKREIEDMLLKTALWVLVLSILTAALVTALFILRKKGML